MGAIATTRQTVSAVEEEAQYLTFMLGTEMFAIGILCIKEIIEYGNLTVVPMMPAFVRGVINLRGAVLPIVDLAYQGLGEGMDEDAYGARKVVEAVPETPEWHGIADRLRRASASRRSSCPRARRRTPLGSPTPRLGRARRITLGCPTPRPGLGVGQSDRRRPCRVRVFHREPRMPDARRPRPGVCPSHLHPSA